MWKSVIASKTLIATVLFGQKMCEPKDRELILISTSNNAKLISLLEEGAYWSSLKRQAPFLEILNHIVTFREVDTVPILYSPLSFAVLQGASEKFDLGIVVVGAEKKALAYCYNTTKCDVRNFSVFVDRWS